MKSRLSYANVMSTLAVFLVLGGSAYAVKKIDGSQIKNRSVPAVKIRTGSLSATEVRSAKKSLSTQGLAVSRGTGNRGRAAHSQYAEADPTNLVKVALGESVTLIESGPFRLTLECVSNTEGSSPGFGEPTAKIVAQTSVDGTAVNGIYDSQTSLDLTKLDSGQTGVVVLPGSHQPLVGGPPVIMISPDGRQLYATYFYGQNAMGSDCFASAFAIV